jgi:hypothetical protein
MSTSTSDTAFVACPSGVVCTSSWVVTVSSSPSPDPGAATAAPGVRLPA